MESKLIEIVKYFKDNGVNIEIKLTADEISSAKFTLPAKTKDGLTFVEVPPVGTVIKHDPVKSETTVSTIQTENINNFAVAPASVYTTTKVPVFTEPPMKTASKPPKEVKEKKAPQKSIFEEAAKEEISEEQIMRVSSEASVVIGREKVKELIAEFASTGKLLDIKKEDRASYVRKLNKLIEDYNEKSAF